jgi:hypothetical protein
LNTADLSVVRGLLLVLVCGVSYLMQSRRKRQKVPQDENKEDATEE